MDRSYYLNLAAEGLCMPIAADLLLHEEADPEHILHNGKLLGKMLEETAYRYSTPLAVPHMDLELEKKTLLGLLHIPAEDTAKFHFKQMIEPEQVLELTQALTNTVLPEIHAQADAVSYIAKNTELLPIGMAIGPFSLMTKLVADPITPVCMAGMGLTGEDDPEIALVEQAMELGMQIILHSIQMQIDAGAKAIFIAEPAANMVFFSPNQLEGGSDIFERFVISYNQRIKDLLNQHGVDLIFHCCGELNDFMIKEFTKLDPAILTLGSSRKLWEDAEIVPKDIVLYGNLPSKQFYSDELLSVERVVEMGCELIAKMQETGHPFILGTECDVLSVPGSHESIAAKAAAIVECGCGACQVEQNAS